MYASDVTQGTRPVPTPDSGSFASVYLPSNALSGLSSPKRTQGCQERQISLSNGKVLESKANQTCSKLHRLFQMSFVVSCFPLVYLSTFGAQLLLSGKKGIGD